MKLLIFKTDAMLSADARKSITESLHTGITDGVVFVDGTYTYEVVEFDSINYDGQCIEVPKKGSKSDIIRDLRRGYKNEIHNER